VRIRSATCRYWNRLGPQTLVAHNAWAITDSLVVPKDNLRPICSLDDNSWDEKAGLQRDALGSQVIDALEGQEIKETGDEEA
jgi:hypothetical protein